MSAGEVLWEVARAIYSLGLIGLGLAILWSLRPAARVVRELTGALTAASEGLRAFVVQRDRLDEISEQLKRIEKAVTKP